MSEIPVIDIFAGPGGLGEGFSALRTGSSENDFRIKLSIEKDQGAHQTLRLRAFFRQFSGKVPRDYYDFIASGHPEDPSRIEALFSRFPHEGAAATAEAMLHELSPENVMETRRAIDSALGRRNRWVLIGGPPCQAYSLAGRSRNKGVTGYLASKDHRQTLYVEYLQVLADHQPAVFVMENVKGLLSAKLESQSIFDRIREDLRDPAKALEREGRGCKPGVGRVRYDLFSLVPPEPDLFRHTGQQSEAATSPHDFVVRAEDFGIPQARHRVIVVGVRSDVRRKPGCLEVADQVKISDAIDGLPRIRSGISKGTTDTGRAWVAALKQARKEEWLGWLRAESNEVYRRVEHTLDALRAPRAGRGSEFLSSTTPPRFNPNWFVDPRLNGVANHASRGHIISDLHRYMFAACHAGVTRNTPGLAAFPPTLLPQHENVTLALEGRYFADRFRVQVAGRPATTVTSHIHKDGHYYIHYDATQCRSLTVREAARLQTFPDNYLFCGGRTTQYLQVGNAVPPLLAQAIARIVSALLK